MSEDLHRPRAERYAAAIASAAAAEERIKTLTETLAEHEWHRTQAETQLDAVQADERFGKVWTAADGEPPLEVEALLCLATGKAFVRASRYDGSNEPHLWVRASASQGGQMRREWPIEDAGPFVNLLDSWELRQVMRDARKRDETEDLMRSFLCDKDGYRAEGSTWWNLPDLVDAVKRVVTTLQRRHAEAVRGIAERDARIRDLQRRVDELERSAHADNCASLQHGYSDLAGNYDVGDLPCDCGTDAAVSS